MRIAWKLKDVEDLKYPDISWNIYDMDYKKVVFKNGGGEGVAFKPLKQKKLANTTYRLYNEECQ